MTVAEQLDLLLAEIGRPPLPIPPWTEPAAWRCVLCRHLLPPNYRDAEAELCPACAAVAEAAPGRPAEKGPEMLPDLSPAEARGAVSREQAWARTAGRKGRPWRRAWAGVRSRVEAGAPCWLCGDAIDLALPARTPWSFSVDHVIALSAGGHPDDPENLEPSHLTCNVAKEAQRRALAGSL